MFYTRIGASAFELFDFRKSSEPVKPNDVFVESTMVADRLLGGKVETSAAVPQPSDSIA
jgi:hypothetical protein